VVDQTPQLCTAGREGQAESLRELKSSICDWNLSQGAGFWKKRPQAVRSSLFDEEEQSVEHVRHKLC